MSAIRVRRRRERSERVTEVSTGGLVLASDWHRPSVKWGLGTTQALLLVVLVIIGLGPILWLI